MKRFLTLLAVLLLSALGLWVADRRLPPFFARELPRADKVLVEKGARKMHLLRGGERVKSFDVSLGHNPLGHKVQEGDSRTPEGVYVIDWHNPKSRFFYSLHVSYPNQADQEGARERGVSPGGNIMIHGYPNGVGLLMGWWYFSGRDWTDGCIAVSNVEMAEIRQAVPVGTPIEIVP